MTTRTHFDSVLDEGLAVDMEAPWGAGFLDGRYLPGRPSWTWPGLARPYLDGADRLLDMGTGDGAWLRTLEPWPACTIAYEEWWPTVPAAVATLRPHGAHLVVCLGADDNPASERTRPRLPFATASFDVITNRHESFDAHEIRRLLRPGASFVTQQVSGEEETSIRALLGLDPQAGREPWTLAVAQAELTAAGMVLDDGVEQRLTTRFTDIAAFVAYVRSVPWSVPEFDPKLMRDRLAELHDRCVRDGTIEAVTPRFWLVARRPS
jgi:SAM-dependent methyltransferase